MKKGRGALFIFGGGLLLIILWSIHFVFNPLGLGPMAETVLPDSFFTHPAEDVFELELLVDGQEAFSAILNAIDTARETIHIQTFIWKDDHIGQLVASKLKAAADRGVKIILNKDALGTFFELGDIFAGNPSPVLTSTGLKHRPNIQVNVNPFADTDHSKYFIVDKKSVILGGMNIADEYHRKWHDYMVLFRTPQWAAAFEKKVLYGQPWPHEAPFFIAINDSNAVEIRTALIELIDRASQSLIIEHAYFSTEKIITAVQRAIQRGVQVSIILPETPDTHKYANQVTINKLLRNNSENPPKIFLFPDMMHAKVMLADGTIAAVGSANLTLRSMLTSREVTLFFHGQADHPFISRLRGQLVVDILKSEAIKTPYKIDFSSSLKAKFDQHVW
ncbi:MAG: phosphatidylserine/phosphatidylglycerophosphate/cardiolipin synthase family protein [Desulfobacteraceae bacterium]|jgi:cardiolipin synthase